MQQNEIINLAGQTQDIKARKHNLVLKPDNKLTSTIAYSTHNVTDFYLPVCSRRRNCDGVPEHPYRVKIIFIKPIEPQVSCMTLASVT